MHLSVRCRTGKALLAALGVAALGLAAAGPAVAAPATTAARPAAAAAFPPDHVAVTVGGSPPYTLNADVTSGGISVLDDISSHTNASVSGQATLAGGASLTVGISHSLIDTGSFSLVDHAGGIQVDATVTGGLTRTSDDTVTWTGLATVHRGSTPSTEQVSLQIVDGTPDPGNHVVTLVHAGQTRTAAVHVPIGKGGVAGLPALVHFPGLGENADNAAQFSELIPASDQNGYLQVIPEHYGIGWQGVPYGTDSPALDDPGYIRALMGVVEQRFGADPKRLYSSGMSNGSWFSQLTACQLSDVFAAYAAVSGPLADPANCHPTRHVPMLLFHGTTDPLVAYSGVAPALAFWTANNGCSSTTTDTNLPDIDTTDGTTVVRHVYQGCPADGPVVFYQINNGGHEWPGGQPFLPFNLLGNTTQDINADQIIWDFVSPFRLP